jgi:NADPH:quinone reductase-like Zn-dependent oxidoreductase
VITTCSPRNFSLVKSLGADAVFDYHAPTCGLEIRKYTDDSLYYALDCYSEEMSVRICAAALASSPPPSGQKIRLGTIAPLDSGRKDVEHLSTFGHTAFGEEFTILGHTIPTNPKHYEFATKFFKLAEGLLAEDKLKPHPIEIRPQGLGGVLSGLEDLRSEKVSGKKLVYRIADTSEDLGVAGSST